MTEQTEDKIDCGICMVQTLHRVTIRKACKVHDINEGDYVRIYVEKVGDKVET